MFFLLDNLFVELQEPEFDTDLGLQANIYSEY
jgi:hypothetical protein